MFDTIIIGAGPAGASAAIYLARKKLKILLITADFGGQSAKASSVENYTGFKKISGPELTAAFQSHIEELKVETKNTLVEEVQKQDENFVVKTKDEAFETKSLIICSGKMPRHLNVPGEKELAGKGVSYCAICDGPLFQEKTVAVIGGGNSALDSAVELEKYAKKVYLVNLNSEIHADAILVDKFTKSDKSEILSNAKTIEVLGHDFVFGLKYEDQKSQEKKEIACEGVFVEIGWTPATSFLKDLVKLNKMGEIEVDKNAQTSLSGIFAAGDVTDTIYKQIIIAAGEGAKAALACWRYVVTKR